MTFTDSCRGRFAPSPTGPLHFGSLVAALGSCLDARSRGGQWRVRLEDLDPPREQPGAADDILLTLEAYGFEWDGDVVRQSTRTQAYALALERLREVGALFACACSRREIADSGLAAEGEPIYPGTCRNGVPAGRIARAMRVRARSEVIMFEDLIQGSVQQSVDREVGDFVLKRADGLFSYQLAVVVDDAEQGITDVVRGADLLASTPRQILLQRLLGLPTPRYAHLPTAVNALGEKLSKQTHAPALDRQRTAQTLVAALTFLGQLPPAGLGDAGVPDVWAWARANWSREKVPRVRSLPSPL
jgi:glutamyl-Q tRNA(Asp) synthetase